MDRRSALRSGSPGVRPSRRAFLAGTALALATAACGRSSPVGATPSGPTTTMRIGAIPDQDPEVLQRLYGTVADAVSAALDVEVEYTPVTDYAAAVSFFRTATSTSSGSAA